MKEFVISEVKAETAVLVGLITKDQDEAKTKEYLDELEFLADTAGAVTVKRFTQRVGGPSSVTYVGSGKLEEIRQYIKDEEDAERPVGMVIFDDELSAKQIRNIEKELEVKILMLGMINGKTSVMFATKLHIKMVVNQTTGTGRVVGLKTGKISMPMKHT